MRSNGCRGSVFKQALQRRANKKNVIKCFKSGYKSGSEISRVYKMTLFLYRSAALLPFDLVRARSKREFARN